MGGGKFKYVQLNISTMGVVCRCKKIKIMEILYSHVLKVFNQKNVHKTLESYLLKG